MRIIFYASNGFGLGHLMRTLAIARQLRKRVGNAEFIFLTNSEASHLAWDEGFATVKLMSRFVLARGRPEAALEALRRVPEPWPTPLAAELLALRARAEFSAGRMLDGLRTTEARARLLSGPEQRRENYALLVDALLEKLK